MSVCNINSEDLVEFINSLDLISLIDPRHTGWQIKPWNGTAMWDVDKDGKLFTGTFNPRMFEREINRREPGIFDLVLQMSRGQESLDYCMSISLSKDCKDMKIVEYNGYESCYQEIMDLSGLWQDFLMTKHSQKQNEN